MKKAAVIHRTKHDKEDDGCAICGLRVDACDFAWMVRPDVWAAASLCRGDICHLSCLAARLGRELTIADFPDVPLNNILRFGFEMGQREKAGKLADHPAMKELSRMIQAGEVDGGRTLAYLKKGRKP
jgi:hypothetical protein